MPVLEPQTQPSTLTPAPATASSNPALAHLDAAISGLEKEVEMDKQEFSRLEALQQSLAKKQDLLAVLVKERGRFVGQE